MREDSRIGEAAETRARERAVAGAGERGGGAGNGHSAGEGW
jgi:hypothetical protein